MTARLRRVGHIIVLIMPLALVSCDTGPARLVGGGGIAGPSEVSTTQPSGVFSISPMLVPSAIPFHTLPVSGCPSLSPFVTSFSLILDQRAGIDVFLHEVGFSFFDGAGFNSPLIFRRSDLATRFGSTLVIGGTSREFAFQPRFGCGLSATPELMILRMLLLDQNGRTHERTLRAATQGSSWGR